MEEFRYLITTHYGTTLNIYSKTIAERILERLYYLVRPGKIKDLISKEIHRMDVPQYAFYRMSGLEIAAYNDQRN